MIETTGGPRQTLSLQTIGPHVGLRGATGVAALVAAALQSSAPLRTVTDSTDSAAGTHPRVEPFIPVTSGHLENRDAPRVRRFLGFPRHASGATRHFLRRYIHT